MTDKLGAYDAVKGVFADLDDGGLTDDEALVQIRKLVGAQKPLPDVIVLMGTLPFTITVKTASLLDTVSGNADHVEVTEFEINHDFPTFERKAETRIGGEEVEIDSEQLSDLLDAAFASTGSWPEPERM